jgi:hypothetical protein
MQVLKGLFNHCSFVIATGLLYHPAARPDYPFAPAQWEAGSYR